VRFAVAPVQPNDYDRFDLAVTHAFECRRRPTPSDAIAAGSSQKRNNRDRVSVFANVSI